MKEKAEQIKSTLLKDIESVKKIQELMDLKSKYLGKSGMITELTKNMKDLSVEERKEVGMISNTLKNEVTEIIEQCEKRINEEILNEKLQNEVIDITLPSKKIKRGSLHPMTRITEEFEDLFVSMGYTVYSGPEIELSLIHI